MKNILIFASIAGIASAIAIYFVSESTKSSGGTSIADAAGNAYKKMNKHIGNVERSTDRGFNAMS